MSDEDTIPVKPSQRSVAQRIAVDWRGRQEPTPGDAYLAALETYAAHADALADQPVNAKERDRLRGKLEAETWRQLDAIEAAATHRARYPKEQAEGQERAKVEREMKDPSATARALRAQALAQRAAAARDGREIATVLADAELAGDAEAVRAVLSSGRARLAALVAEAKVPSAKATGQQVLAEFEARAAEWTKQHPTSAETIARLQRAQHATEVSIREAATFAARMFGLRREPSGPVLKPVPTVELPNDRLQVGPAFDLLTGGQPGNIRRRR